MTLVDALIVASIFVPIVVLIRIGSSHKRKLYKQFNVLAEKNGLNIVEKEFWANSCIGIDNAKKIVLFVRNENNSVIEKLIALNNLKECKVATSVESLGTRTNTQNILQKVELQMYFTGNSSSRDTLNFYDHNRIYNEDFEVMRAEKWKNIINEQLSTEKSMAMAS